MVFASGAFNRVKSAKPQSKDQRLAEFKRWQQQYYRNPTEDFISIDQQDAHDPQSVAEYAKDCQRDMQMNESTF